jgi:tRNA nucleotidyltransferase (CCA-adding enzyme)
VEFLEDDQELITMLRGLATLFHVDMGETFGQATATSGLASGIRRVDDKGEGLDEGLQPHSKEWEEIRKKLPYRASNIKLWGGKRYVAKTSFHLMLTPLHELAHGVHFSLPQKLRYKITKEYVRALKENKGFISKYSKQGGEHEFFAECYTAYFTNTAKMRERNPAMADIMKTIFKPDRKFYRHGVTSYAATTEEFRTRSGAMATKTRMTADEAMRTIKDEMYTLHSKKVHREPLQEARIVQNMLLKQTKKKVKPPSIRDDAGDIGIIDPDAANLPRAEEEKLTKVVKSLQRLFKALPPNAVYSSTEAPPKGAMTFVTEDREAEYWLQSTEVFPQTPDVGDAIEANPQAQQILQDLGQEGTPYVVGGGVRDILIGKPSKDIDIEVHGVPMDKLGQLMEKHGGKPEQVGKQFGVFKVGDVDVSLPRTETKTGTKHTDFDVQAHTSLPLKQATRRRDFTMNALMYDVKNHRILDFFGGHDDIVAKKIKHVDDKTFVEDPLRVYRAAQFAGRFGFSIDESTIKLARSMDLSDLPKERVFEEMSKLLLRSPKPSVGLQALDDMGVLKQQMPELKNLQDTHQRGDYHAEGDVFTHTKMVIDEAAQISKRFEREKDRQIIMLAALSHDLGKPATTDEQGSALGHSEAGIEPTRQLLSKLTTDTEIIETVLALVEHHLVPLNYHNNRKNVKDSTFRRLINKHGTRFLQLLSAVSEADNAGRLHKQPDGNTIKPTHEANEWFRANINRIAAKEGITEKGKLQPLVTGKDLLDLGFVQGKRVGEVLQDIQRQQEDGKLTDKKEAIEYLQNIHKSYISEYFLKAKGKYKGRTGGITPDWTMKLPGEERDIDEWAEARRKKAEERQWGIKPVGGQPIAKTWVGSLADKGFTYPLIKQVIGSQMWFAQDGIDYIANLGTNEDDLVTSVEKANFVYNRPSISYAPSGRNNQKTKRKSSGMQGERYQGDTIDDEEDDYND